MLTDKTSVSYISYLWDSFFLFQLFFLLFPSFSACQSWFFSSSHSFSLPAGHDGSFSLFHAPLSSAFPLFLFTFPCLRGMIASFHSPMPRSALFFMLFLFTFPCPRGMIASFLTLMPRSALFSFFSSSFSPSCGACLPLFSLSCPARLCFPSFPLHFPLPAGHDCSFSHSHAPLGSVFPFFLFTFPCSRGMIAPFHSPMPRSALLSQIASSVILVRESAPLYNTCIIWVIKPFGKSPC